MTRIDDTRLIRAPRGPERSAQELADRGAAADADEQPRPRGRRAPGGAGGLRRHRPGRARLGELRSIVATLRRLEDDQTLLVQSGKPVGVFRTHADAPRVLIANSNLVPRWATWDHFNELDRKGLMMYGQMTAGSWIYIGAQGIVQGTYETFVEMGRQHYGGDLSGRWMLTAGLGGMGGAQPLAAVMAGASCLAVECQPSRIEMRLRTGYSTAAEDLDEALAIIERSCRRRQAGLGRPARQRRRDSARAGPARRRPDCVTDQTSAHDPVNGYLPEGWSWSEWASAREHDPKGVERGGQGVDGRARPGHAGISRRRRARPSTTATTSARWPRRRASRTPSTFPGFVPAYIRPLFCRGIGPFRWVALSRRSGGHLPNRRQGEGADPRQRPPAQLARHGAPEDQVPGPAGAHLLGGPGRPPSPGPGLQRDGRRAASSKAPIVIGRDHLDSGSVASPNRETEGDDATAPTPSPTGRCSMPCSTAPRARPGSRSTTAAASAWASPSTPAWSSSADGTPEAARRRIERVLWNDPATGVMRHADAGYEIAIECAREKGLDLPSLEKSRRRDTLAPLAVRRGANEIAVAGGGGRLG